MTKSFTVVPTRLVSSSKSVTLLFHTNVNIKGVQTFVGTAQSVRDALDRNIRSFNGRLSSERLWRGPRALVIAFHIILDAALKADLVILESMDDIFEVKSCLPDQP